MNEDREALSHERRNERLTLTREPAVALLEDLAHIREILGRDEPSRSELRRLSGMLRRILVERDLSKIAAPRIGRITLLEPNNKPFIKLSQRFPFSFFASGGASLFGYTLRGIVILDRRIDDVVERQFPLASDIFETVEARLDGFFKTTRSLP